MVLSNSLLYKGPGPPRKEEIWGSEPPVRSAAAYCQITLAVVIIALTLSTIN